MRSGIGKLVFTLSLAAAIVPLGGCPTTGVGGSNTNTNGTDNTNTNDNATDNTNDNTGGDGVFTFNLTDIPIHSQGRIRVGDDFIAYTDIDPDRTPGPINYFMPGDTEGRGIPGAEDFDNNSF